MMFLSANTALPSSQSQPVHSDADFDHPLVPFALVVNIPLRTMTVDNGSTELWPGTHAISQISMQEKSNEGRLCIKPKYLVARRRIRSPVQLTIPKGSVLIRDMRLWHAGKPNYQAAPRVLLAMIHFACWYRNPMR